MKVFLVGFMASGKTVLGKRLARRLNLEFVDLDQRIEEQFRVTINDLFSKYDEEVFRNIEQNVLHQVIKEDNVLISTGGGTPCFFDNMEHILNNGLCIYLKLHPKSIFTRLTQSKKNRPLVKELDPVELKTFIYKRLEDREQHYRKAHMIVRGERMTEKELAELILTRPIWA